MNKVGINFEYTLFDYYKYEGFVYEFYRNEENPSSNQVIIYKQGKEQEGITGGKAHLKYKTHGASLYKITDFDHVADIYEEIWDCKGILKKSK